MDDSEGCLIGAVCFALYFCGCFLGDCLGTKVEQDRAVEANVGRWVIDPKTGESRFEYGIGTAITKGARP